jgi:single-strand DNA-binding protein
MAENGLNSCTLIGRLGKDPDLRFTQNNQAALNFSIAITESWFDAQSKERKERTEWMNIVVWGKRAEGLNKVLFKGSRICVQGRLQTRSWEDKQGNKRYTTEVVANDVILLGGGQRGSQADDSQQGYGGGDVIGGQGNGADNMDDIPFALHVSASPFGELHMFGKKLI